MGFPCCDRKSVNVVETQCNLSQYLSQEEEDMELQAELLALDHTSKSSLDLDPELEMKVTPRLQSQPKLDTSSLDSGSLDTGSSDTGSSVQCYPAEPELQVDRSESLHPFMEELGQQDISPYDEKSNSTYLSTAEEAQMPANHHSIHVQTSKHLFWADKLIQTSQESVERAISMHFDKKSRDKASRRTNQSWVPKDTVSSQEQLQAPSPQSVVLATKPQEPRRCFPSPELSPVIGLTELVNLATSLAMASSNKKYLPNMELRMQDPSKKAKEPTTEPMVDGAAQPTTDQMGQEKLTQALLEKPLEDIKQKTWKQENKNFLYPYFDFNKPGVRRTFEGKVKLVQSPAMFPPPQETKPEPPQKPQRLFPRDPAEAQANRTRERRLQQHTALTQMGPAAATATKAKQTFQRARDPRALWLPVQYSQIQVLSLKGTVDMRSMKAVLQNVGVQLSPQKMCEALQLADLDGQVRTGKESDPQGLQTLFLEMLFKLMSQDSLPSKSLHAATRLSGLSNAELVRLLHRLCKTGARSPYSQVLILAEKMRPEHRTRNQTPHPEVRFPKSYQASRPKLGGQEPPRLVGQSLESMRPSKLAPPQL